MIPTMERKIIQPRTLGCMTTSGKKGREKRTKPYVPIFSKTPARMTDPAVGASMCASGSQVWNGNIGTLMAKPKKKPPKIHHCRPGGMRCPIWWNCRTENEAGDVEERSPAAVEEVEGQDRQQHQHRSGQGVEEELDGRVELPRLAPDA